MVNVMNKKNHIKLFIILFFGAMVFTAMVMYFGIVKPHQDYQRTHQIKITGTYLSTPTVINDFQLIDNHGKRFTKENLKGRWTMLFFGFTNCGMVCPTTMDALNKMYKKLQQSLPQDKLPQIVLITVDPDRDTIERLNDYVNAFNSNFVGARAEIVDTINLEKQLHIAAAKMQVDGQGVNNYTINHSAEILLINPGGKIQAYLSYPHQPDEMVKDYQLVLSTFKG